MWLAACGQNDDSAKRNDADTAGEASCETIPQETAGPFPGDGSNGPNVRTLDGVVRSDIRSSVGAASGAVDGVECVVELALIDATTCAPFADAAVYVWQCDGVGRYSMYSDGVTDENWLRGIQSADADGVVRFTSIVPGCYPGRWPHIHFDVYASLDDATGSGVARLTSQLAFPRAECEAVFGDARYGESANYLARLSLESDGVFADDGAARQLATMTGSVTNGYLARLVVPV